MPADSAIGDFESAFANAPVKIDVIYTTPYQHQAPMEPHATMAVWEGEMLTVHMSAQLTTSPREGLARTLNIPKENIRIVTRYVGGGFGSKLPYYVDATLAAIGARTLGRPVKVAMTRPQVFHTTTHRTASEQHVRLGAERDGRLIAYSQDALVHCARFDMFTEPVCESARMLYAAPNRLTRHRRAKLDLPRSDSMRAPGDAIGLLALECAMDELADALALDPVELRLRNDTQTDPEQNRPFSSRHFADALREGAARFGWDKRVAKPASLRDGRWLLGLGVASAIRADVLQSATARARLESDGGLTVELAMTDIGNPDPDRRRDNGVTGRSCHRSYWRYPLPTHLRLGWLFWGGDLRSRGSRQLPETQSRVGLGDEGGRGIGHARRPRQHLFACRLRRPFRRSRGGSRHG
jgi:xanthine dehydrogenase YagR molybdenum-binding subunit